MLEVVLCLLIEIIFGDCFKSISETDPLFSGIGLAEEGDEVDADDGVICENSDLIECVLVEPERVSYGADSFETEGIFEHVSL